MTEIYQIVYQIYQIMHQILPGFTSNTMKQYSVTWKWTCLLGNVYGVTLRDVNLVNLENIKYNEPSLHPNLTKSQRQATFKEWEREGHPHLTYK